MLENPGDELYFGEVYRRVLQESWLPDGAVDWERLGKSTRGWRPTQRGLEVPQVSPSQAIVRQCFSLCAASIRDLPWQFPPGRTCDNRLGRRYWSDEKEEKGLTCSYYDLYMRSCMRSCLDTGCLPPRRLSARCPAFSHRCRMQPRLYPHFPQQVRRHLLRFRSRLL
ncbi:hypothetical protein ES703_112103 [subsurface metagenome]